MTTKTTAKPKRDARGRWQSGQSANPAGRPAGTGLLGALRSQISDELPGIVQRLIREARNGDVQAARVLLERVLPAVKPIDLPVTLDLDGSAPPGDALRAVLQAVASGAVTPTQASLIAAVIDKVGKQDELNALRERVSMMEGQPLTIVIEREESPLARHDAEHDDEER